MLKSEEHEYALSKPVITIGRDVSNAICIRSNLVSKFHAKLLSEDRILIDLESRNGTYINQRRIHNSHASIANGDIIKFGDFEEEFTFVENAAEMDCTVMRQPALQSSPEQQDNDMFSETLIGTEDQLMCCERVEEVNHLDVEEMKSTAIHIPSQGLQDRELPSVPPNQADSGTIPVFNHHSTHVDNDKAQVQAENDIMERSIAEATLMLEEFDKKEPVGLHDPLSEAICQLHRREAKRKLHEEQLVKEELTQFKESNAYYLRLKELQRQILVSKQLIELQSAIQRATNFFKEEERTENNLECNLETEILRLEVENEFLRKQNKELLLDRGEDVNFDVLLWHDELVRLSEEIGELMNQPPMDCNDDYDVMTALSMCFNRDNTTQ